MSQITHRDHDSEPQIAFARDPMTHELRESVTGWFLQGHPLTISYDPTRIVPPGDHYDFGDPARPIVAHVQFREGGPVTELPLASWIGQPSDPNAMTAARMPKLQGQIQIPADADWVTIWVSYARPDGPTLYDSSFGRNFRFRFYHDELKILQSDVLVKPISPLGKLKVRVAASPSIDRILMRYRVLTVPTAPEPIDVDMVRTGELRDGLELWDLPEVSVPADRVVSYDVVYFSDGRPFKDNNQGQFFLAVDPTKRLHPQN